MTPVRGKRAFGLSFKTLSLTWADLNQFTTYC